MPCYSGYDETSTTISYDELTRIKDELDLTTRLLCKITRRTIREIKSEGKKVTTDPRYLQLMAIPGMADWWTMHKEVDRKRKAAEAMRNRHAARQAERRAAKLEKEAQEERRKAQALLLKAKAKRK